MAWYRPCMICSRGGSSGRNVDGGKILGLVRVCGRGFWVCFWKRVLLGYFYGIFWGWWMGVNSGRQMGFPWEILNGPRLGDLEVFLVRKCGEALRWSDGVLIRWWEKVCRSVKHMVPGLVNLRIGDLVGLADRRMLKAVGIYNRWRKVIKHSLEINELGYCYWWISQVLGININWLTSLVESDQWRSDCEWLIKVRPWTG